MKNLEYLFRRKSVCDYTNKKITIFLSDEDVDKMRSSIIEDPYNNWILQEHKEPIKLKQWEYDLIETNDMPHNRPFITFATYKHMLDKGHFKGVYDTNMSLYQILNNCEVIE